LFRIGGAAIGSYPEREEREIATPKPDVGPATAPITEDAIVRQQFMELAARWKRERGPHSSSARLAEHPAYQQIIGLGPPVVPLLLGELERELDHWFRALHALTGVNPVTAEHRGDLSAMREDWLRWGKSSRLASPAK
jgi:hypothetical protein